MIRVLCIGNCDRIAPVSLYADEKVCLYIVRLAFFYLAPDHLLRLPPSQRQAVEYHAGAAECHS